MTDEINETPISATAQSSSVAISASEVEKECLDIIKGVQKNPLDRAKSIQEIICALTTATPELTRPECDDALGSYLRMLEQHGSDDPFGLRKISEDPGTQKRRRNPRYGAKRAASLGAEVRATKKPKQDDSDFLWTVHEQLSENRLGNSLDTMLRLLRVFTQDLKFTKSLHQLFMGATIPALGMVKHHCWIGCRPRSRHLRQLLNLQ